jgi:probable F420-dependent oxidoreductase
VRIYNTIPQNDLRNSIKGAVQCEGEGYDGIVTLENRHDPFLPLAAAAPNTKKIELATGVAIAFLRSPMSTANLSWDLNVASKGRFVLGLGPQIKAHNEKRFSVPWGPPVSRMKEYVASLRAIWSSWKNGEQLKFSGQHYQFSLMPPNFVPESSPYALPPITLAAVGPKMLQIAGEVADGVKLHPFCTRKYLEEFVIPNLDKGLSRGKKNRENFEISGGSFLATGKTDEAVDKMASWVRYRIGFYASTPAYWPVLAIEGFPELGPRLNALTKQGDWDRLAEEVPDQLLHACCVIGRHDEIKDIIEKRFGGITDTLLASASYEHPAKLPPDLIGEIKGIPVLFKRFST